MGRCTEIPPFTVQRSLSGGSFGKDTRVSFLSLPRNTRSFPGIMTMRAQTHRSQETHMKTTKTLVRGLLACTLFACGGTGTTDVKLPDPGRPYEMDEVYPPDQGQAQAAENKSVLVADVKWRSESIQFWNVTPLGEEPVILMVRTSTFTEGDVLPRLEEQAQGVVTAAELWRAVTGRDDVPEALALDHALRAQREGLSPDYRNFDMSSVSTVDKAQPIDLDLQHQLFPRIDGSHCWNSRKQFSVDIDPAHGQLDGYACTSAQPAGQSDSSFVRFTNVTLATACPTSFNTTGSVRVAASNNKVPRSGVRNDIAQVCFDTGGGWTCQNTTSLPPLNFVVSDLGGSTTPHRMGLGIHPGNSFASATFAAARLLSSPPLSSTNGFCSN